MPNPQQETKIELVTEAVEALVLASVIANAAQPGPQKTMFYESVVDARRVLHDALACLLAPTLRVVQSQRRDQVGDIATTLTRTVAEVVPYGGLGIDGMNLA
jgi:hypothetical protein